MDITIIDQNEVNLISSTVKAVRKTSISEFCNLFSNTIIWF